MKKLLLGLTIIAGITAMLSCSSEEAVVMESPIKNITTEDYAQMWSRHSSITSATQFTYTTDAEANSKTKIAITSLNMIFRGELTSKTDITDIRYTLNVRSGKATLTSILYIDTAHGVIVENNVGNPTTGAFIQTFGDPWTGLVGSCPDGYTLFAVCSNYLSPMDFTYCMGNAQ